MCTLIALFRCVEGSPIVIAANRDEYFDRPAEPPRVEWTSNGRRVAAPRDLRAGGTWLGVNDAGVFVGLTNRPTSSPDPARRSRGHLVADALRASSAGEVAAQFSALSPGLFNPFNVLVADASEAHTIVYDERPRVRPLSPGVHVIGNADPDDRRVPKIARLLDEAHAAAVEPDVLAALGDLCRGHRSNPSQIGDSRGSLDDTCIHLRGYGTRSSTLLRLADSPDESEWRWADGPPCSTSYTNITDLLRNLGRGAHGDGEASEARAMR